MTAPEPLGAWLDEIELRARCTTNRQIRRGPRSGLRSVAADSWRCEGRDQVAGQMSIWDCLAEIENPSDQD